MTTNTFQLHQVLAEKPCTSIEAARILNWEIRRVHRAMQSLIEQGLIARVGNTDGRFIFGQPKRRSA